MRKLSSYDMLITFKSQLRAEVEEAEGCLQQEKESFAQDKKLFVSAQDIVRGVAACRELQELKKQSDTTLNNKKMDLLKVKVSIIAVLSALSFLPVL